MKRFLAVFLVLCAVLAGGPGNPAKAAGIEWKTVNGVGYVCDPGRKTAIVYDFYPNGFRMDTRIQATVKYRGEEYKVRTIADGAFLGCNDVVRVSVPDNVTRIGEFSFYRCSRLVSVLFGPGSRLTAIGDYAFKQCPGLAEIEIPSHVNYYGEYAFDGCNAVSVTFLSQDFMLPGNFLPGSLLAGRRITQTNGGHGTAKLKVSVSDGMAEVIPVPDKGYETDTVTVTGSGGTLSNPFPASGEGDLLIHTTFKRSKGSGAEDAQGPAPTPEPTIITEGGLRYHLDLEDDTASVLGPADPNAKKIEIPSKITVYNHTFTVNVIGANAFQGMTKLKEVTIGKNVATVGERAFYKCENLKILTIRTKRLSAKTIGEKAFGKVYEKIRVTVPEEKKTEYRKLLEKKGLSKKAKYQ